MRTFEEIRPELEAAQEEFRLHHAKSKELMDRIMALHEEEEVAIFGHVVEPAFRKQGDE